MKGLYELQKGDYSKQMKERLGTLGLPILITLTGFLIAYQFVDPAPPAELTMTTGQRDGSYYHFGNQYSEFLNQHGIQLKVEASAGSLENLERLKSGAADAAFIQGGTITGNTNQELTFLGSLYFEPLWVFHRSGISLTRLSELRGKRIAIGPEGSGTRAIALQLLHDNSIDAGSAQILPLTGKDAAEAVSKGEVDAIFLVTSAKSQLIEQLFRTHGVQLMSFKRADGYTRKHPFLSTITLPEGTIDMAANIPDRALQLLAPSATLVARSDLHPALQTLLLQAASASHSGNGLFEYAGEFPSPLYGDLPISEDAQRYYKSGPPFLQRFLPFWAATMIDRLKVMLLPLLALLLPLFKVMPPLYRWRVRSRIYQHYRDLSTIDQQIFQDSSEETLRASLESLRSIENEVRHIHVPLSYSEELYELRTHLALVRAQIEKELK